MILLYHRLEWGFTTDVGDFLCGTNWGFFGLKVPHKKYFIIQFFQTRPWRSKSRSPLRRSSAILPKMASRRKQIFIDGNKRTAVIFANHFLISNGVGVIFIDPQTTGEYKKLLVEYYETGRKDTIVDFLKHATISIA